MQVSETHTNLLSQKGNIDSRGSGRVVSVLLSLVGGLPHTAREGGHLHTQAHFLPA